MHDSEQNVSPLKLTQCEYIVSAKFSEASHLVVPPYVMRSHVTSGYIRSDSNLPAVGKKQFCHFHEDVYAKAPTYMQDLQA